MAVAAVVEKREAGGQSAATWRGAGRWRRRDWLGGRSTQRTAARYAGCLRNPITDLDHTIRIVSFVLLITHTFSFQSGETAYVQDM